MNHRGTFSIIGVIVKQFERKQNDRGQVSYTGIVRVEQPANRNGPVAPADFELFTFGDSGKALSVAGIGALVQLDGQLSSRSYVDKNGMTRLNTNLALRNAEVLQPGQGGQQPYGQIPPQQQQGYAPPPQGYGQQHHAPAAANGYPPPAHGGQPYPAPAAQPPRAAPPPQQYAPPPAAQGYPPQAQGYPPPAAQPHPAAAPAQGNWQQPPNNLNDIPF